MIFFHLSDKIYRKHSDRRVKCREAAIDPITE